MVVRWWTALVFGGCGWRPWHTQRVAPLAREKGRELAAARGNLKCVRDTTQQNRRRGDKLAASFYRGAPRWSVCLVDRLLVTKGVWLRLRYLIKPNNRARRIYFQWSLSKVRVCNQTMCTDRTRSPSEDVWSMAFVSMFAVTDVCVPKWRSFVGYSAKLSSAS